MARSIFFTAAGRRQQVGRERLQATHHHVAVRIDEAWQQGAPLEVDQLRLRALELHHLVPAAHRDDPAARLGDGLGTHRLIVHREDRAAGPDALGRRRGLGRGGAQQE
jgi:hypothetical protein